MPIPHYIIVTLAGAIAEGMFGGGGHGPDFIPTKADLFGASLAKLCFTSSISAGVICLFIFSFLFGVLTVGSFCSRFILTLISTVRTRCVVHHKKNVGQNPLVSG